MMTSSVQMRVSLGLRELGYPFSREEVRIHKGENETGRELRVALRERDSFGDKG